MFFSIFLIIIFPLCLDATHGVYTVMYVLPHLIPETPNMEFYIHIYTETEILLDFYSIIAR